MDFIDTMYRESIARLEAHYQAALDEVLRYIEAPSVSTQLVIAKPKKQVVALEGLGDEEICHEEFAGGVWSIEEMLEHAKSTLSIFSTKWDRYQRKLDVNARREADDYLSQFPLLAVSLESAMRADNIDVRWGLPSLCIVTLNVEKHGAHPECRHIVFVLAAVSDLPPATWPSGPGYAFRLTEVCCWEKSKGAIDYYVTVDRNGKVWPAYKASAASTSIVSKRAGAKLTYTIPKIRVSPYELVTETPGSMTLAQCVSLVVSAWRFREWHWNVVVSDDRGSICFPLRQELVKKLFKDRDVEGPRKKGLLHWVSAHQRKTGSNVKTHLRGSRTFTLDGMQFSLGVPGKHWPMLNDDGFLENYRDQQFVVPTNSPLVSIVNDKRLIADTAIYRAAHHEGGADLVDYSIVPRPRRLARYYSEAGHITPRALAAVH